MSYTPLYTSAAKVEGITQFTSSTGTSPSTAEILTWIEEVEADADARCLASYTETDQMIDIPAKIDYPEPNTIAWFEAISGKRYTSIANRIFFPPFLPIISISKLYRRTSSLSSAEVWEELTEGPGADSDYIIIKKKTKTNKYLGFAIYFYNHCPYAGYKRIKMTYNYGWNLNTKIIGEWCTLQVALKVLDVEQRVHTPYGIKDKRVGYLSAGLEPDRRITRILMRIENIEKTYFPDKSLSITFI